MKLSQKNFDSIIDSFNHKITKIETDLKWIKWLLSGGISIYGISFIGGLL